MWYAAKVGQKWAKLHQRKFVFHMTANMKCMNKHIDLSWHLMSYNIKLWTSKKKVRGGGGEVGGCW